MDFLYNIFSSAIALVLSPVLLFKMSTNAVFRAEILERIRISPKLNAASGCVWFHAASVGEAQAAKIVIEALRADKPKQAIALSTFTRSGREFALKEGLEPVFLAPLDLFIFVRPFLNQLKPRLLVLIEAEFWPCLLRSCFNKRIPILLVNGRMTEKTHASYARFAWFFRWMTEGVVHFSMRGQEDADRIRNLGIDDSRISIAGNVKFDALDSSSSQFKGSLIDSPLKITFGSTRPGDEGPIIEAMMKLREQFSDLYCVIAPRHLERLSEVERLIKEYGLDYKLHSRIGEDDSDAPLILVDQMGVLKHYYSVASIAFVGGGFNPRFGGHNILEPAAYNLPVLFGPHMNNFVEEARLLAKSGGGWQLADVEALYPALLELLENSDERKRRGAAARKALEENQGAVEKSLEWIDEILDKE